MKKLGKISTAGLIIALGVSLALAVTVSVFIGAVQIPFDEVIKILVYKITGFEMDGFEEIKKTHIIIVWNSIRPVP